MDQCFLFGLWCGVIVGVVGSIAVGILVRAAKARESDEEFTKRIVKTKGDKWT